MPEKMCIFRDGSTNSTSMRLKELTWSELFENSFIAPPLTDSPHGPWLSCAHLSLSLQKYWDGGG